MSWNPVLDKFVEIKNEFLQRFGYITYNYKDGYTDESETCLDFWVESLNELDNQYQEYTDLISCLELNQFNNFLLLRYGRYSNIYDGEVDNSGEDFWDKYSGFYRECRSVVIDVVNDCIVCATPRKFFNLNEMEETSIENISGKIAVAKTVEFSDKLDGSMQSARYYNGEIVMAGSQAINPNNSWRLQDGYRMIHSTSGYENMLKEHQDLTFIFEYISLADAHVVKYTKDQEGLYLIGIKDVNSGREYDYKEIIAFANKYDIPTTQLFNKTLDQLLGELDDKSSDEAEGFVINIDGYRVKLKYNDYVHIHKALSKLSSINLIIRSIADDCYDDLLSKLPAVYHDNVKKVSNVVFNYIRNTENIIYEYYVDAPKSSQKEFMIWVDKNVPKKYRGFCRELYYGERINVLKKNSKSNAKYLKLKDMGVTDYSKLFLENENENE